VKALRRLVKGRLAAAWLGAICVLAPRSLLAQQPEIPSAVGYRKGALADLRRLPDLAPLARDAAFRLHMLRAEKGEGVVARVESFSTSSSFAEVKVDLETQLARELRARLEDRPDADVVSFAREAGEDGVAELGPAVLGTLSPAEFRREVAAVFRPENVPPSRIARGEIVGENGMRTRVEVQQPYFDLGLLGWMPITRIRFVRFVEGGGAASSTEPREPGASPPSPLPPSAPRPESNP
jgi:hypothetical protein